VTCADEVFGKGSVTIFGDEAEQQPVDQTEQRTVVLGGAQGAAATCSSPPGTPVAYCV
jgi:hypothetical protein